MWGLNDICMEFRIVFGVLYIFNRRKLLFYREWEDRRRFLVEVSFCYYEVSRERIWEGYK